MHTEPSVMDQQTSLPKLLSLRNLPSFTTPVYFPPKDGSGEHCLGNIQGGGGEQTHEGRVPLPATQKTTRVHIPALPTASPLRPPRANADPLPVSGATGSCASGWSDRGGGRGERPGIPVKLVLGEKKDMCSILQVGKLRLSMAQVAEPGQGAKAAPRGSLCTPGLHLVRRT